MVGDRHPFRVVLGRAYRGLTGGFLLLRNFSVQCLVSVKCILDDEANKFYDKGHQLYEAALLT